MHFAIISLFPEMFQALEAGIIGRAHRKGLIQLHHINPRDFTHDPRRTIDDRPFGGGPGMVMKPEPLYAAITAAKSQLNCKTVIYLSPQGSVLQQADLQNLSQQPGLVLVAGRYEGIDERIIDLCITHEYSLGDYVISGGELAAMVLIDGITRLLPGSLGDKESALQDSFVGGLLDYPHYTRPQIFAEQPVPEVLLRGNHEAIARWRLKQALGRTWLRRSDLIAERKLTPKETILLDEFRNDYEQHK